jgi:hippurate hydrolase
MIEAIQEAASDLFPFVRGLRHTIHAHPELSFEEYNTARFISEQLTAWGIVHTTGIAGTGIVAVIKGINPEKTCTAIRAELDALPIEEANEVAYKSKVPGVMHACGHDVHTSCLLGVAKILWDTRETWEGTAKLIFQPGEEKHPGGGSIMIAEGVLENPGVDRILALHVYPTLPSGTVGFRPGQYMASTDEIHIIIHGKGGHAALPHQTIDPIAIAAQVITGLQQLISRRSNPVVPSVLSFGRITGGTVNNVIPDRVELSGTLRTMDETWRAEAHRLIRTFVTSTCESWGATADIDIPIGYPSLFNNPELTAEAEALAVRYLGADHVKRLDLRMTADDFAFYSHAVPGCYFRLGTSKAGTEFTASVHNAHFDIDEEAMRTGTGLMAWLITELNRTAH